MLIVINRDPVLHSDLFFSLGDFKFDVERGRHLFIVVGIEMVDNKFLYFKIFVPLTRKSLKVDSYVG